MKTRERNGVVRNEMALSITGMTCGGCANTVTRVLSKVPGVIRAEVDLANSRAVVEGTAQAADLVAAVQAAGFGAKSASQPGRG